MGISHYFKRFLWHWRYSGVAVTRVDALHERLAARDYDRAGRTLLVAVGILIRLLVAFVAIGAISVTAQ